MCLVKSFSFKYFTINKSTLVYFYHCLNLRNINIWVKRKAKYFKSDLILTILVWFSSDQTGSVKRTT